MSLRFSSISLALISIGLSSSAFAQSASEALDSAWVSICAGATAGSNIDQRCQEILNAGPGSGGRRSAAALGNNLELFAAQGRLLMAMAKSRAKAAAHKTAGNHDDADQFWLMANQDDSDNTLLQGSRWSLFGSFARVDGGQKDSRFERGSEDSGEVVLVGLDYRFNSHWTGVFAAQRDDRDATFNSSSGGMSSQTNGLSAAINYNADSGFATGLSINAGESDARTQRQIDYTLVLDAGTPQQRSIRIAAQSDSTSQANVRGADFYADWERSSGAWTWRYGGDVSYQQTRIDQINENNARGLDFQIRAQEIKSLQAAASINVARTFSAANSVWQPYARLRWSHEFQDDPRRIDARFRGGDNVFRLSFSSGQPDRNFGEIGLGVSAVFSHGWQAYLGWQRLLSHDLLEDDRIDLGWRKEF